MPFLTWSMVHYMSQHITYLHPGEATRRKFQEVKMLLGGRGLKFVSTLRGPSSKTKRHLLSYFFILNTVKGTAKGPAVALLKLSILKGTKIVFSTPKRHCEQPRISPVRRAGKLDPSYSQNAVRAVTFGPHVARTKWRSRGVYD